MNFVLRKRPESSGLIMAEFILRANLCKNQAKWEMKNFYPAPPFEFCMQLDIVVGCLKCTLFGFLLYYCHGNTNCLLVSENLIFNSEIVVKCAKCVVPFLKSIKTLQHKTWSRYNTIILVYICVYCSLLYQICVA